MQSKNNLQGRFFRFALSSKVEQTVTLENAPYITDFELLVKSEQQKGLPSFADTIDNHITVVFGSGVRELHVAIAMEPQNIVTGIFELAKLHDGSSNFVLRNPGPLHLPVAYPFSIYDFPFDTVNYSASYPRCKTPWKRFQREHKGEKIIWSRKQTSPDWHIQHYEKGLFTRLFQTSQTTDRMNLILDTVSEDSLLRNHGLLKSVDRFCLQDNKVEEKNVLEAPLCFPIWGTIRLAELTGHFCLSKSQCFLCFEKNIWTVLKEWYQEVFQKAGKTQSMMMADGTIQKTVIRRKGLIILGSRGTGKTKFFQSFCGIDSHRIIHVKNRFNKAQWARSDEAWLILIDDFNFHEDRDVEIFKALVAGEGTIIDGMWLSFNYLGGISCVILCNDTRLYNYFAESQWFSEQCFFLNIDSYFLGPPSLKPAKRASQAASLLAPSKQKKSASRFCPFVFEEYDVEDYL